jgi:hypothetical protein
MRLLDVFIYCIFNNKCTNIEHILLGGVRQYACARLCFIICLQGSFMFFVHVMFYCLLGTVEPERVIVVGDTEDF